jgi:hypothetical protein
MSLPICLITIPKMYCAVDAKNVNLFCWKSMQMYGFIKILLDYFKNNRNQKIYTRKFKNKLD